MFRLLEQNNLSYLLDFTNYFTESKIKLKILETKEEYLFDTTNNNDNCLNCKQLIIELFKRSSNFGDYYVDFKIKVRENNMKIVISTYNDTCPHNIFRKYYFHGTKVIYSTEEYYSNPCNETLLTICKKGKYIEIDNINLDWNYGLYGACEGGHLNIVNLMIEKGASDWNWGLNGACIKGSLDIINLMIEMGANNWNWGLSGACLGGNLNIINLMIEMGASNWNWGLSDACLGGHLNIVNLMIEKGANDWNWGLSKACRESHLNIVNLMIKMGATECCTCKGLKHNF